LAGDTTGQFEVAMIETSVDADHNLVTFKNTGAGTKATVEAAFRLVKRQYETFGPVKLLLDWSDYQGMGEGAPSAARRIPDATPYLERVAFLANAGTSEEARFWIRVFDGIPVRLFDGAEKDAAIAWLLSG
jgi:hypothetical protein